MSWCEWNLILTLLSFVVPLRKKHRRKWVQGICGMTMTEENRSAWKKKTCINPRHMSRPLFPVAARSKVWVVCWDYGFECSWGTWMSVSCECCVLSSRGLCDGL